MRRTATVLLYCRRQVGNGKISLIEIAIFEHFHPDLVLPGLLQVAETERKSSPREWQAILCDVIVTHHGRAYHRASAAFLGFS